MDLTISIYYPIQKIVLININKMFKNTSKIYIPEKFIIREVQKRKKKYNYSL